MIKIQDEIQIPLEIIDIIIDSLQVGVYVVDSSGKTLYVNKTYEDMSLLPRKELIGKRMDDLVKQKYFNASASLIVLKNKKPAITTFTTKTNRKLLSHGKPIFNKNQDLILVVNTVYDISSFDHYMNLVNIGDYGDYKGEIIARSSQMVSIINFASKLTNVDSTVLITGESGVGKEVLARLIHSLSIRKNKPFIKINCASIPENLIETELFGYEGGSFTGSNPKGKKGIFEAADQGTIFLDEIGELPVNVQAKLLQVLQDKQFTKVGAIRPNLVDVRIIAATNKNIEEMITNKTFREDLYYRLNVISIYIPPLRERQSDIEPLTEYMVGKINAKYKLNKQFSKDLIDFFKTLPWRGNIRELENTIEKLMIFTEGNYITKEDYMFIFSNKHSSNTLIPNIFDCEKEKLKSIMATCKNIQELAKQMGISRSTAIRKLKKYNLIFQK
jgi:PAS domain S-box-containing protein